MQDITSYIKYSTFSGRRKVVSSSLTSKDAKFGRNQCIFGKSADEKTTKTSEARLQSTAQPTASEQQTSSR